MAEKSLLFYRKDLPMGAYAIIFIMLRVRARDKNGGLSVKSISLFYCKVIKNIRFVLIYAQYVRCLSV